MGHILFILLGVLFLRKLYAYRRLAKEKRYKKDIDQLIEQHYDKNTCVFEWDYLFRETDFMNGISPAVDQYLNTKLITIGREQSEYIISLLTRYLGQTDFTEMKNRLWSVEQGKNPIVRGLKNAYGGVPAGSALCPVYIDNFITGVYQLMDLNSVCSAEQIKKVINDYYTGQGGLPILR